MDLSGEGGGSTTDVPGSPAQSVYCQCRGTGGCLVYSLLSVLYDPNLGFCFCPSVTHEDTTSLAKKGTGLKGAVTTLEAITLPSDGMSESRSAIVSGCPRVSSCTAHSCAARY